MLQQIVKPLRSGQITIPIEMREKIGIDGKTLLEIRLVENELRIKPIKINQTASNTSWFAKLYQQFAFVRKQAKLFSEKEIDNAIDKAVDAVRKKS